MKDVEDPHGQAAAPARIVAASPCSVFLPESSAARRLPRASWRARPAAFWAGFESRALIYDAFWHVDGQTILLVGPPPLNLESVWRTAEFVAQPSGRQLTARLSIERSTLTVVLDGAEAGDTGFIMTFAGHRFEVPINANLADRFAGRRVLFTMSKDNDLAWISEWARFHSVMHKADAVVLFDNGSTRYRPADIADTLAAVPGLTRVLVFSWPYLYGPHDPSVVFHRFWANFLQVSSFSVVHRRVGAKAFGLLNADIDELAAPIPGSDIFQAAHDSQDGFYRIAGRWVESIREPGSADASPTHRTYRIVRRDPRQLLNAKKWALDPSRAWLTDISVKPSVHRVLNMPRAMHKRAPMGLFWHFKGVSTNWKQSRKRADRPIRKMHHRPPALQAMFTDYLSRLKDDG